MLLKRYIVVIAGCGLIFVILGFIITERTLSIAITLTAIGVIVILGSLAIILFQNLRFHIDQVNKQVLSLHSAIALVRVPLNKPVFLLRHSVAPDFIELVAELIRRTNTKRMLEIGSGSSSLYMISLLPNEQKGGRLVCLENDRSWIDILTNELSDRLLSEFASVRVIYAPLVTNNQTGIHYYDIDDQLSNELPFDMIVIDGPHDVNLRGGVFHCLLSHMTNKTILLFDDGNHPAIKSIVMKWVKENPNWSTHYYPTIKGTWVVYNSSLHPVLPLP